jgi:hypothetical protein
MLLVLFVLPADGQKVLSLLGKEEQRINHDREPDSASGFLSIFQVVDLIVRYGEARAFVLKNKLLVSRASAQTKSRAVDRFIVISLGEVPGKCNGSRL